MTVLSSLLDSFDKIGHSLPQYDKRSGDFFCFQFDGEKNKLRYLIFKKHANHLMATELLIC